MITGMEFTAVIQKNILKMVMRISQKTYGEIGRSVDIWIHR